jgi:hypothetical protein
MCMSNDLPVSTRQRKQERFQVLCPARLALAFIWQPGQNTSHTLESHTAPEDPVTFSCQAQGRSRGEALVTTTPCSRSYVYRLASQNQDDECKPISITQTRAINHSALL